MDIPTHNRRNFLDLCFASHSLMAKGSIAFAQRDLDVTSDHFPLLISVPFDSPARYIEPKLRFGSINEGNFKSLLSLKVSCMTPLEEKSRLNINKRAEDLIDILQSSFAGSAK